MIVAAIVAFFSAFFGAIASFFLKYVSKRLVFGALIATVFAGVTTAFAGGLYTLVSNLTQFHSPYANFTVFLPSNFYPCIAAIVSTRITVWVYRNTVYMIRLQNVG